MQWIEKCAENLTEVELGTEVQRLGNSWRRAVGSKGAYFVVFKSRRALSMLKCRGEGSKERKKIQERERDNKIQFLRRREGLGPRAQGRGFTQESRRERGKAARRCRRV